MKTHQLWEDLILIIPVQHRKLTYKTLFTTGSKIHKNISLMGVLGVGVQVLPRKNQLRKVGGSGVISFYNFRQTY